MRSRYRMWLKGATLYTAFTVVSGIIAGYYFEESMLKWIWLGLKGATIGSIMGIAIGESVARIRKWRG